MLFFIRREEEFRMRRKAEEIEFLAAAFLYGEQQTQESIGRSLGLSQPVISRLLKSAVKDGYIETRTRFIRDKVSEEDMERILARVRPVRLQEILSKINVKDSNQPGPVVHVYPSHSRNTTDAAWRYRTDEFARACAKDVLEVLESASGIGVSWGETVAAVIAAMKNAAPDGGVMKRHTRTTIPLIGEPLGLNITQHSSSVLAARLEEVLNPEVEPGQGHTLSLAPVPALIPADMTETEIQAIRKLIGRITAYREIFGTDRQNSTSEQKNVPLIRKIDAVLTSTSTHERPLGFDDDNLIRAAGVPREKLNDLVIGDLCGAMISRPNLDVEAKAEVKSILRRWTGVTISQLRDCAARARDGAPGILVLAIGARKAPVVYAALRNGLIQHLFMDQDLADRLEEICLATGPAS
jgi:DNA-binding transcriptional regulator LsrR (DeoR family)